MQGNNIQDIRIRIEQILRAPSTFSAEEFFSVAITYANLVEIFNKRVSLCNQWIDAGFRSEAIHMSTLEPDLLEAIGDLDLGELHSQWVELCEANEAMIPPETSWELASYLNDAWDLENKLKPDLQELRLAMLRHEDLKTRITLLRALVKKDTGNSLWETILTEHEIKRVEKIEQLVDDAILENDLMLMGELKREILSADWHEPPPLSLINKVTDAKKGAKKTAVTADFIKVSKSLFKAMSEGNEKKARRLAERWEKSISLGHAVPKSALANAIPVFEWLDGIASQQQAKDDFESACEMLLHALDNQASMEELEVHCNKIERLGFGVPSILENRYKGRAAEWEKTRKRRNISITVVCSFAIIAIAVGVFFLNQQSSKRNIVSQFQTNLKLAIESTPPQIETIIILLNTSDATILDAKSSTLITDWSNGEKCIAEFESDNHSFDKLRTYLEQKSAHERDQVDIDRLKALARTPDRVSTAKTLEVETHKVIAKHDADLREKIILNLTYVSSNIREIDNANNAIIGASTDLGNIDELLSVSNSKLNESRTMKEELLLDAPQNLVERFNAVDTELTAAKQQLSDLRKNIDRIAKVEADLQKNHSLKEHMDAIQTLSLIRNYERSSDVKIVSNLESILLSQEKWKAIYDLLQPLSDLQKNSRIQEIHDDLVAFLNTQPNIEIQKVANYVQTIIHLKKPENFPENYLSELLVGRDEETLPTWAEPGLERFVTKDGNYYGFDLRIIGHSVNGEEAIILRNYFNDIYQFEDKFVNLDSTAKTLMLSSNPKLDLDDSDTGFTIWREDAEDQSLLLNTTPKINLDIWYLTLLQNLYKIENMEPTVQLAIASRLALGQQSFGREKFEELEDIAEKSNKNPPLEWFNPKANSSERETARQLLATLDANSILELIKQVDKSTLEIKIPGVYTFVGHMSVSEPFINISTSVNQPIYTLQYNDETLCTWAEIGTLSNNRIIVKYPEKIYFGTPLFVKEREKETK